MRCAILVVVALALPLAAQDSSTAAKPAAPPRETAVQQADSPLVAAAKRANRKGKKPAKVITNETLRQTGSGGHVTTTANQAPLNLPPPPHPTPEMEAAAAAEAHRKELAEQTAVQKKEEEKRNRTSAAAAARAEDGDLYDEIPPASTDTQGTARKPPRD